MAMGDDRQRLYQEVNVPYFHLLCDFSRVKLELEFNVASSCAANSSSIKSSKFPIASLVGTLFQRTLQPLFYCVIDSISS